MSRSELDRTFAALSDPTRRAVVGLLRKKPRRAGELASALGASAPAMSRHLRVLRSSGLVEEESPDEDARVKLYRLRRKPFADLRRWIEAVEELWTEQLAAFAEHVEAKRR